MDSAARPILFVSLPESGLLNPLLVLAGELARRGVPDLWFATDEHRREEVEALSDVSKVSFASLGEVVPELSAVTWDDEVYREVTQSSRFKAHRAVVRQSYRPALQARKYRELEQVVDEVQPALMVVDCVAGFGVDLALARGIPYVLNVPFVASNVLTSHNPFGASYTPKSFPVPNSGLPARMSVRQKLANTLFKWRTLGMFLHPDMAALLREDAAIRKELGIAPPNAMTRVDEAAAVVCSSVAELDYPFDIPDRVSLVGAVLPPLPEAPDDDEVTRWLDAQSSVVYMGFGTITRLTREEVAALVEVARRMSGTHQFLWKLPKEQQHLLPEAGSLPDNLRVESWVPSQLDVLAHPNVSVFFSHGGGNAYHEGVYFGKPQVVRPLWVDCFDQAVRGRDFGISLTLDKPHTVDPDDVVDKLTRVTSDPAFRTEAERLGALQRAAGGRAAAADLVTGLLPAA
ncbi:glycosyltransferase [Streptomyces sp. SID4934]|uniref:glycosyltransferase n=1 Tax=unclassified Streptomyces TaxID=2593676 RepID=UPI00081E852E|nr:glycosyltransferase [Streptomyces sp. ScaeMP-6W]MYQ69674.1 glycosyltransferase [Streptomyces sp. SID4934]SCD30024.1 polyene glycosyltransferase [Streptomyces sp. ScaeMP-6W]